MAGIAQSIELFNQAFRLALPYLSADEARNSNVSRLLSEAIQRRLKLGMTDPVQIAAEAVVDVRHRV